MQKWTLILLGVLAVPSFAGIQGPTRTVNSLTINGGSFGGGGSWALSVPTLEAPDGYLTHDVAGKSLRVTFQKQKGPGTKWSLVETERFTRYKDKGAIRGWYVSERQSGYTMKVRMAEGPFEGWYLGREAGNLVLVKDRRNAATLEMLEKTTEFKGK